LKISVLEVRFDKIKILQLISSKKKISLVIKKLRKESFFYKEKLFIIYYYNVYAIENASNFILYILYLNLINITENVYKKDVSYICIKYIVKDCIDCKK